ncbi:MAG: hypothetical protein JWO67_5783 [Streptosporangiaceae bacterium]|nr:hypothetical protein [Streptosporangiaceae bacterium]
MTEPTTPFTLADAAITYGPTGIRCGCGRDAHSNLSPCHAIDVGPGMRSADIPDASQGKPDHGTCPSCSKRDVRLKKDGTVRQHWKYGWPRSGGNPPCGGSGELPTVLNAGRTTRHLAEVRRAAHNPSDEN